MRAGDALDVEALLIPMPARSRSQKTASFTLTPIASTTRSIRLSSLLFDMTTASDENSEMDEQTEALRLHVGTDAYKFLGTYREATDVMEWAGKAIS